MESDEMEEQPIGVSDHEEEFKRLGKKIQDGFYKSEDYTINDIIDLFNNFIRIYEDARKLRASYARALIAKYHSSYVESKKIVNGYFYGLTPEKIRADIIFVETSVEEQNGYFNRYGYFETLMSTSEAKKISHDCKLALLDIYGLEMVLGNKVLANDLSEEIKGIVFENPQYLEIIVPMSKGSHVREYYPPKFSNKEVNELAKAYCSLIDRSVRYLRFLVNRKGKDATYILSEETKAIVQKALVSSPDLPSAIRYYEDFDLRHTITFEIVDDIEKQVVRQKNIKGEVKILLSSRIFKNTKTSLDAFNITIEVADLIDRYGRCSSLLYDSWHDDPLDALAELMREGSYGSTTYYQSEKITQKIFIRLAETFEDTDRSLYEGCIKYIEQEINPLIYPSEIVLKKTMPNVEYYYRCLALFAQLNGLLTQYQIYVNRQTISNDLIEANKSTLKFDQYLPLKEGDKYYSLNEDSNEALSIKFKLLREESPLACVRKGLREKGESFFQLVAKHNLSMSSYDWNVSSRLKDLKDAGIIVVEHRSIEFSSDAVEGVWSKLQDSQFIDVKYLSKPEKDVLDGYAEKGWFKSYRKLFSSEESLFLNYWLRNEEFANGKALRNKYMHGGTIHRTEEQCKEDYWMGLRILMICLVKIHDDILGSRDSEFDK